MHLKLPSWNIAKLGTNLKLKWINFSRLNSFQKTWFLNVTWGVKFVLGSNEYIFATLRGLTVFKHFLLIKIQF